MDNGDAYLKRQIIGREVIVAITNGRVDFGPWTQAKPIDFVHNWQYNRIGMAYRTARSSIER
jgi:thiamine phosphate synthase YjbQ (UPF0047 family)